MLRRYHIKGQLEAGCDEAGRGCLAGPVFAAAVVLPEEFHHPLLNDSKKLSEESRNVLKTYIKEHALAWAVSRCDVKEIDKLNILWASVRAMHKAIRSLELRPDFLLIDGNRFKEYKGVKHLCIVKGDAKYASIAAASILAKTHRDEFMLRQHKKFPHYGWDKNKAYPTAAHRAAIVSHGISPLHRRSFKLLAES